MVRASQRLALARWKSCTGCIIPDGAVLGGMEFMVFLEAASRALHGGMQHMDGQRRHVHSASAENHVQQPISSAHLSHLLMRLMKQLVCCCGLDSFRPRSRCQACSPNLQRTAKQTRHQHQLRRRVALRLRSRVQPFSGRRHTLKPHSADTHPKHRAERVSQGNFHYQLLRPSHARLVDDSIIEIVTATSSARICIHSARLRWRREELSGRGPNANPRKMQPDGHHPIAQSTLTWHNTGMQEEVEEAVGGAEGGRVDRVLR